MRTIVENRRDRLSLVTDAGWGRISGTSVAAGILVGYGLFVILAGLAGALLGALDVNVDLTGADLQRTGVAGGLVLGLVLFCSWWFGAYTAGRMARRAGLTHGVVVFFMGVLVAVAVAALVEALGGTDDIVSGLERLGVPTTAGQWADIFTVAGIASLVGMLAGCLVGGAAGERWHAKLLARAQDPAIGPEAAAEMLRRDAIESQVRRRQREIDLTCPTPEISTPTTEVSPPTTEASTPTPQVTTSDSDRVSDREPVTSRSGTPRAQASRRRRTPAAKARSEEESTAS